MLQSQDIGHDRRCASLRLGYVKWVAAQPGVSVPQSQARIVDVRVCCWAMWEWVAAQPGVSVPQSQARIADVRVCCWAMWEWVAAQPGVSVPQSQARSSMCESAAGLREVGGCTARSVCATESGTIVDVRVCCWAMWEWVAAQPGVSVPQSQDVEAIQARSSMCEFAAGLCGSGWLHSQECLCHFS